MARLSPRGRHPQRDDEHPDDRTLFGARARRWSSCSAARRTSPREFAVRAGPGPRHRRAHRDAAVDLHELADADVGAGAGAGLRARRRARHRRAPADRRDRVIGAAAHPAVRAADRAGQRPCRDRQRAGQFRAGLRGARPGAADPREARRHAGPGRSRIGRVRRCPVLLPVGRQGVAGLARRCRGARRSRGAEVLHGISFAAAARADGGAGRLVGRGQVDHRLAAGPALRRRLRGGSARRRRRA